MCVGRIFPGGPLGHFPKTYPEGPKVVKFVFSHSKLRKYLFLLNFSKSRVGQGPLPPPSDAHERSTTKIVSAVFHLKDKAPKRELEVNYNEILPICSESKCLGVTLDRTLTYRQHRQLLRKKRTSLVVL